MDSTPGTGDDPIPGRPERIGRRRHVRLLAVRVVGLAAVLALATWMNLYAARHELAHELAESLGYLGILAAAAASGFNLVVPVPIIAFYPFFMDVGFDPVLTVLVIAVGMTAGDLLGYLIGRTTREVMAVRARGIVSRLEALRDRRPALPYIVMFLYAAVVPLPNELLVIPLAFLRYPVGRIFLAVLAGNLIFNSLIALGVIGLFEDF